MEHDRLAAFRRLARWVPGAMAAGRTLHRLLDPDLRTIERLRKTQAAALFQPFPTTSADRYPELFAALAERLAGIEKPRVLSFGCADGSEVRSLRRWLPQAELVGIDINPRAIEVARRHLAREPDAAMSFLCTADLSDQPEAGYDAILALAVFRHGELERDAPATCEAVMPFARFDQGLAALDRLLKPGGWLTLWNGHFRFADTALAEKYEAHSLPATRAEPLDLLYGPDNRRIDASYCDVLFRKEPPAS